MNKQDLLQAMQAALEGEQREELEALARRAVVEHSAEGFGYYFLAEANLLKGNEDNAEICLVKAIELDESNVDYQLRFAQMKEQWGEHADAESMYMLILDKRPDCAPARLGLAAYYLHRESDEELALFHLNTLLEQSPGEVRALALRAQAYLMAERPQAALDDAEAALAAGGGETACLAKIAALSALNRDAELPQAYEALLACAPQNPLYRMEYARLLAALERTEQALAQAEQALALSSSEGKAPVWELQGELLLAQKQYEKAAEVFGYWIEAAPGDWTARLYRAQALQSLGQTARALEDLRAAESAVTPASRPLLQAELGRIALQAGDLKEAARQFQLLSKTEDRQAQGLYGLGLVLHKAGQAEKAFEYLRQASALGYEAAQNHLERFFAERLKQFAEQTSGQFAAYTEQNRLSPTLQTCFGKTWKYSPKHNALGADVPKDIAEQLQAAVRSMSLSLSPERLEYYNPVNKKTMQAAYKITSESGNRVELEIVPLDGSRPYAAGIERRGEALAFAQAGGQPVFFV